MEHIITLFHGSEKVIETPVFGEGKKQTTLDLGFIVPKAKGLQRNGQYPLCGMDFAIAIHWIRSI